MTEIVTQPLVYMTFELASISMSSDKIGILKIHHSTGALVLGHRTQPERERERETGLEVLPTRINIFTARTFPEPRWTAQAVIL